MMISYSFIHICDKMKIRFDGLQLVLNRLVLSIYNRFYQNVSRGTF